MGYREALLLSVPLPLLEIYVVGHPDDTDVSALFEKILAHFHGPLYSGLMGGAVDAYIRSEGWDQVGGPPRRIPGVDTGGRHSRITAIVPIVGPALTHAVQNAESGWSNYFEEIVAANNRSRGNLGIFPFVLSGTNMAHSKLLELIGRYQQLAMGPRTSDLASVPELCRDLAQGIAQLPDLGGDDRVRIFISHTRVHRDAADVIKQLTQSVRDCIGSTHFREFFDAHDIQPGEDWISILERDSFNSTILALRTDFYASRDWCQREILSAKSGGMPIVMAMALIDGEERGSFLMDNVPHLPIRREAGEWLSADIFRCLNVLIDETLKRRLWRLAEAESLEEAPNAVWFAHAPEPITVIEIFEKLKATRKLDAAVLMLHPDPPLGPAEVLTLERLSQLVGISDFSVVTPRLLAIRQL